MVEAGGQIEGDEADAGAPIFGVDADDVLVLCGAGAEFEVVIVAGVDVGLIGAAGEAIAGADGGADGFFAAAGEDRTVASHVLFVEGEDFVFGVGGLEVDGVDAEFEVAEVHADVGGAVVVVVLLDHRGARVGREAGLCAGGLVVGFDVHGAEGCADIDVVLAVIAFVGVNATAGKGKERSKSEDGGACETWGEPPGARTISKKNTRRKAF